MRQTNTNPFFERAKPGFVRMHTGALRAAAIAEHIAENHPLISSEEEQVIEISLDYVLAFAVAGEKGPEKRRLLELSRSELGRLEQIEEIAVRLSTDLLTVSGSYSLRDAQQILRLAGEPVIDLPRIVQNEL